MKLSNIYKGKLPWQFEFDRRYCCWANNHMGWAKMKKANKKLAKQKLKQEIKKEISKEMEEYDNSREIAGTP
jgi:hypothetical protein